jgi:hypothetical protein
MACPTEAAVSCSSALRVTALEEALKFGRANGSLLGGARFRKGPPNPSVMVATRTRRHRRALSQWPAGA